MFIPAFCNFTPTSTPIGFAAAEESSLWDLPPALRLIQAGWSNFCLSLKLQSFSNLVFWDVSEGNLWQLLLNLLIPILESVSKRKGQPESQVSHLKAPVASGKLEAIYFAACLHVPHDMGNNRRVW